MGANTKRKLASETFSACEPLFVALKGGSCYFFLGLISLMPFFVKYFNFTQSERVTTSVKRTRGTIGSPLGKLVAITTI